MKSTLTLLLAAAALWMLAALTTHAQRNARAPGLKLVPQRVTPADRKPFTLDLPEGFTVSVAAEGLGRARFMARSPDGRIFVTDLHSLADNRRGAVYALDGFDPARRSFAKVTTYLKALRNPNSVAFYTDPSGAHWFYLAL